MGRMDPGPKPDVDTRSREHDSPDAAPAPPVLAIVGATAVGKTAVAVSLAANLGDGLRGEIISLDSRQMYRRVDTGTAKPTAEERALVPHHLIDIAEPAEILPLAEVQARAYAAATAIRARGRVPILVGGTGQFLWAVLEGWSIPEVEPDAEFRTTALEEARVSGPLTLHARLAAIDPASAAKIHPNNVRRVIRALEVWHHTGVPMSEAQARHGPPWPVLISGLRMSRPALYARVDARIDRMIASGLEEEVRSLIESGLHFGLPALQSVGYQEWRHYLDGEIDRDEVIVLIRRNTRRLVRMQATWFRDDDPRIRWHEALVTADMDQPEEGTVARSTLALATRIREDFTRLMDAGTFERPA